MKMPIRYALTYPARETGLADRRLRWDVVRQLDFEPPDLEKFPLLRLAYKALETGGAAGCVLNAADEVAVSAFLQGRISFPAIAATVEAALERFSGARADSLDDLLDYDRRTREFAAELASGPMAQVMR
jgi:1-deoxy-D-xylulose-5-phosphate reductoisomerase